MELSEVKERLTTLGYTATDADDTGLTFLMSKVEAHIFNFCNISEIPENLEKFAIDRVCAEYLKALWELGSLPDTYDVSALAHSLKMGDTTIEFGSGDKSNSQLFEMLTSQLTEELEKEMLCFRKLFW